MPMDILFIETDDGGTLEVWPENGATGGAMLRVTPPKEWGVPMVDSIGFFKFRNDDLRKLAKEILRVTKKTCCCGGCDNV